MRSRARAFAAAGLAALFGLVPVAAACGLADDDTLEFIPPDEIPFGLDQTTTTTSTTTTTVVPQATLEPTTTTSTLQPVQTAPVEVYFVIGLERLQRQTLQFSFPIEPLQVLAQLEEGPPSDVGVGLRTAVRPNLAQEFESADGIATIDLRGSVLNRIGSRDQNLAIAQLVLTVGRLPGIGQVRFTIDGEPAAIPVPPTNTFSEPGEPLTYEMFSVLIGGIDPPSTTEPTTPTGTTEPPPPVTTVPSSAPDDPGDDGTGDAGEPGDDGTGEPADPGGDAPDDGTDDGTGGDGTDDDAPGSDDDQ